MGERRGVNPKSGGSSQDSEVAATQTQTGATAGSHGPSEGVSTASLGHSYTLEAGLSL